MEAAESGHKEIVELLLENGADLNINYNYGVTALKVAVRNGHREVVALLLEREADLSAQDKNDYSLLMCEAAERGHKEGIALLLEKRG